MATEERPSKLAVALKLSFRNSQKLHVSLLN